MTDETPPNSGHPATPVRPTLKLTHPMIRSDHVLVLQRVIGAPQDRVFGPQTAALLMRYQTKNGLVADGICGQKTWAVVHRQLEDKE
jgi:peptidoglycan hydrolase-like protein with peptidoglycan-binding domain